MHLVGVIEEMSNNTVLSIRKFRIFKYFVSLKPWMWAALTKNGHPSKLRTAAIHLYTSK